MFHTFYKFFKGLNSADRSWQLSLALSLSLFIALSPVFAPHNIVVYLLAFLLNLNLALFFVGAAIFGAIAYLADPLIESAGYYVLTLPSLEGVWTEIYNNPYLNLSNFNDTMIMGSFVIALIAFVPSFFIFQLLSRNYRTILGHIPIAKMMLNEPLAKSPALIRWWGLLLFLIVFGLIGAIYYLLSDMLIKSKLEDALSEPIGYEVTIDRLKTSLSPLGITIEGVQIPDADDPMKNRVEIGHLAFNIELAQLLHKKIIIDEFSARGILLETDRKKRAVKLPDPPKEEAKPKEEPPSFAEEKTQEAKDFLSDTIADIPDAKTLVKNEHFKTLEESKVMLDRLQEISAKWKENIKTKFNKSAIDDLQNRYKSLEAKAKNIKNAADLQAVVAEAKEFRKEVKAKRDEYSALMKEFEADRKEAREIISRFDDLPKEDYAALKSKYSFDTSGAFNIAESLVGGDIIGNIKEALRWYEMAKPYIKEAGELKSQVKGEPLPKPTRGKSRIVKFKERNPQPKWWVKQADFDITTKSQNQIAMSLKNATGDQPITNRPMETEIKSLRVKGYEKLAIEWTHDRRNVEIDRVNFAWLGVDAPGAKKNRVVLAPMKVDWQIDGTINRGVLESKGALSFREVKISYENARGEVQKLLANTLAGIDAFDVNMRFWGNPLIPDSAFSSDLDNKLAKRFKEALSARIKEFELQLKAEIDKMAREQLTKLGASEADIAALEKVIKGETDIMGALEERIGKNLSEDALKKELEDRLKKEAQNAVKKQTDDLKDKAKNLLKK